MQQQIQYDTQNFYKLYSVETVRTNFHKLTKENELKEERKMECADVFCNERRIL